MTSASIAFVYIAFRYSSNSMGSHSFDHSPSLRWHKELRPDFTATLHEQANQDSAHLVSIFDGIQLIIGSK